MNLTKLTKLRENLGQLNLMNLTVFVGILLAVPMATAKRASLGEKTMKAAGKAEPGEAMKEAARPASLFEKIMRAADKADEPDEADEAKRESLQPGTSDRRLGDQPEKCLYTWGLDLQLIIDSSQSIGSSNFESMMMGIADGLISQFEIGEDKTRVALFIFNDETYNIFGLEKYIDASSLKEAIKTVKYNEGGTWTAKAMQEALITYRDKMRDDSKTARVCVVFTDGTANDDKFLQEASKAWADQNVAVFAVGIGNMISESGLEKIAGSNERIMTVANFKSIGRKAKSLLVKVCKAIPNRDEEGGI